MGRRAAVLIAAIGIAAAVWWALAPFVATTTVPTFKPLIGGPGPYLGDEQVWVSCGVDGSSRYATEDGGPWFSDLVSTPDRPPPGPACAAARGERLPTAAAFALIGLGLAVLVLAADQASRRRAIDRHVEAMAAELAAAENPPPSVPSA